MDSPLVRRATISRPTVSKEASSVYSLQLEGVSVKFDPPYRPNMVTINDMAVPQLPSQGRFIYNFATEYRALEECKTLYRQVAAEEDSHVKEDTSGNVVRSTSIPVVPISSPILKPIVVGGDVGNGGGVGGQNQTGQGDEESLNLIDFEAASDPFEMVTLNALNDRAELESIWTHTQPSTTGQTVVTSQSDTMATSTPVVPLTQPSSSSQPPSTGHTSTAPPPTGHTSTAPPTGHTSTAPPPTGHTSTAPLPTGHTSTTPSPTGHTSTATPPVPKPRRFVPKPSASDGLLPPVTRAPLVPQTISNSGSPTPSPDMSRMKTPSQVTPAAVTTVQTRVAPHSIPPAITNPLLPNRVQPSQPVPVSRPAVPPPYSQGRSDVPIPVSNLGKPPPYSSGVRPPAQQGGVPGGVRVFPAPGGGNPTTAPQTARPSPPVPPKPFAFKPQVSQYELEDPREELTDEELANVLQLSSMGFNEARTARAYKRLNKDQAKVLDFLFLVGQLEELGYKGNSAETALIACDSEVEGATDYLKNVSRYKEMGYKEKDVHEAYNKGQKDWDKALDVLLQSK